MTIQVNLKVLGLVIGVILVAVVALGAWGVYSHRSSSPSFTDYVNSLTTCEQVRGAHDVWCINDAKKSFPSDHTAQIWSEISCQAGIMEKFPDCFK